MTQELPKVAGNPSFVKDVSTGSLLNTDKNALASYKKQKRLMATISEDRQRISNLEQGLDEVKSLLTQLLRKLDE